MYLTKSELKLLQFFTGNLTESFTLRETARNLKMHVSLAHRAVKPLLKNNILEHDKHKNLSLNYKENHEILAFAEYIRRDDFLKKHKNIALFTNEVLKEIEENAFVLILFGSSVVSNKAKDTDILLIIKDIKKIEFYERFLNNLASDLKLHIVVIPEESVYEMLSKRDEKNLMNEILNKHIVLYGAELFYKLIQKGRL